MKPIFFFPPLMLQRIEISVAEVQTNFPTTLLTERAVLDGESEKAEPILRWRGISGECAQWISHLERGDSLTYSPF